MGTGESRSVSGRRAALIGFLILVTSGPASAENFALFSDLLSVAGRAGNNYHQNRIEARVRGLEAGLSRQAHANAQRGPDPEVIAGAERDLGLILSTPMPDEQRRRLLVGGMTRAKCNDPGSARARRSPHGDPDREDVDGGGGGHPGRGRPAPHRMTSGGER